MPVHMQVERGVLVAGEGPLKARVGRRAEGMLALLQLEKAELSLLLCSDDQIHQLNKIYRGKNRPTDVLAFSMREGDFGRLHAGLPSLLLGDVIVSIPTAKRQAKTAKREALDEVTMLVAHGLLHLLGWDHETPAKDVKMRAETDRLVAAAVAVDPVASRRSSRAIAAPKKATKSAKSTKKTTAKKTKQTKKTSLAPAARARAQARGRAKQKPHSRRS